MLHHGEENHWKGKVMEVHSMGLGSCGVEQGLMIHIVCMAHCDMTQGWRVLGREQLSHMRQSQHRCRDWIGCRLELF